VSVERGLDFASIKARHGCAPSGWSLDRRFSQSCSLRFVEQTLVYVLKGRATLQAAGQTVEAERGDLITVAPDAHVAWRVSEAVQLKLAHRSQVDRVKGVRSLRDRLEAAATPIATGTFVLCAETPQTVKAVADNSLILLHVLAGPLFCALFPLGESRGTCFQINLGEMARYTIAGLDHAAASVALELDRIFGLNHREELFLKVGDRLWRFAGSSEGRPLGPLVQDRLRQLRLPSVTTDDTATIEDVLGAVLQWACEDKRVGGVAFLYLPQAVRVSRPFCARWNVDICYAQRSLLTLGHSDGPQTDLVIESLTTEPVRCSLTHYPGGQNFAQYELLVGAIPEGGRRVISSALVNYGD